MIGGRSLFILLCLHSLIWGLEEDINRYNLSIKDSAYCDICTNPYINAIRSYFEMYAEGKAFRDSMRDHGESVARVFQNDSMYEQYYTHRFVVLRALINPFGGIQAEIVFEQYPELLFSAWIYRIDINEYQLRSIETVDIDKTDRPKILKEYKKANGICKF